MLKMPQQHYIKFLREVAGCSVKEIAERVSVHWRTAKKYADQLDWNASVTKRKNRSPVMGPFMEIIDTWLEEDRLVPRKQRHTGVRIFQRQDLERQHYAHKRCIADLWEDERCKLLTLPKHGFEAFRLSAAAVNKYGEIRVGEMMVPLLGMAAPGSEVLIQTFWDRLVILNSQHQQIREVARPYTGRTVEIPWSQVCAGWLRKPRSVTHSQFLRMLPEILQAYVTVKDLAERKDRLQANGRRCLETRSSLRRSLIVWCTTLIFSHLRVRVSASSKQWIGFLFSFKQLAQVLRQFWLQN